ncbi:cytochrome-c peroxidase [Massilia terrae]|uniref:Cytochrome-c peroxidase n=1 Tax=Massilia terrae TaxID=1811224 RepID=A0ABT2CU50_9BURK|nr:cytochrome c peroxidase [Massilia terrae]MCS0656720.1 cytochrome-c peroxidase [Massilia terrae]
MRTTLRYALAAVLLALAGCGGSGKAGGQQSASAPDTTATAPAVSASTLSLAAQVGQKMFFDQTLSGSGKQSCASCHDPNYAYGPPNKLAVQLGGPDLAAQGQRAAPSLRYIQDTPAYADQLDNPDGISAPGPGGGFTWDGRARSLADQAKIPLLAPNEMANAGAADVVAKLRSAAYADLFRKAFGSASLDATDSAFNFALAALQAFQMEDPSFHPYTSKFDLYAGNKIGGALTAAETRGMRLFTDPNGANCASCHYQGAGLNGSSALFTDFSYEAIGVPRNMAIAANQDPKYFDLGLCGPNRSDHPDAADGSNPFCGMFKAPSLRNVATRSTFFHNGVIHSLEQAIRFYNTRDTNPEIWYPTVGGTPKAKPDPGFPTYGLITTQYTGGTVRKFNDLPAAWRANIDTQLPLDGRAPGGKPPMSDAQIADLLCFLKTLTDGYQAATQSVSGPCVD